MNDKTNNFEKYGNFSDDGREFVISKLDTPRPWINYAWSEHLLCAIDQTAGGSTLYRDDDGNRSVAISDRFIYLKDADTNEFWTLSWGKIRMDFEHYKCRHGLGYTTFECDYQEIKAIWTVSCAESSFEVWKLQIVNQSRRPRRLAIYPGVKFELGGYTPYGTLENYSQADPLSPRILFAQNWSHERPAVRDHAVFVAGKVPDAYETSMREFLGGVYGSWNHPAGVVAPSLSSFSAMNEDMVGIYQYNESLSANGEVDFYFAVGSVMTREEAVQSSCFAAENSFDQALHYADKRTQCFDRLHLELPDKLWNNIFNIWGKQQLLLLKDYARVFVIGFRDSLQDAAALAAYVPELAGDSIVRTLAYQLRDGSALRGWCPIDEHKYGDSGVWLPMAIAEYLRETGDVKFLDRLQKYYDGGCGTVWEHNCKALDWFEANLGAHGLPKLYFGDWNDSLNIGRKGNGESVWLAMALLVALQDTIEVAGYAGRGDCIERLEQRARLLRENIEKYTWDGSWYLRGFDDLGQKVGSSEAQYGKIFSEPQSWAVMAGLDGERLKRVWQSVNDNLRTANGLVVCNPPFAEYDPNCGRISCMRPGWGENGSCYCHVTAFQMVADALMRDGNKAYESIESVMPFHRGLDVDVSRLEPYAFSNMFRGPGNRRNGETFKGWTSGTVPWAMRGMTHYMVGIRPDFDALIFDPVLPAKWQRVRMIRHFRGKKFDIRISRSTQKETVPGVYLDGVLQKSNRIGIAELPQMEYVITIIL